MGISQQINNCRRVCQLRISQRVNSLLHLFDRRAIILNYHRITSDKRCDIFELGVSVENFSKHLKLLRKYGALLSLDALIRGLQQGEIPHNAIAVTFDDGYADNLHYAKSLLERYDIPATVFVTSGFVGSKKEFWWDLLAKIVCKPLQLPSSLSFSIHNSQAEWHLSKEHKPIKGRCHRSYRWDIPEKDTLEIRRRIVVFFRYVCLRLPEEKRMKLLNDLLLWSGTELEEEPYHAMLSFEELRSLSQGGLVTIGAHTVSHPVLSLLSESQQAEEILESKKSLETILGSAVTTFAYPYGQLADYTSKTVSIIRKVGFSCACSSFDGVVNRGVDHFQLPRFAIQDWNENKFEGTIKKLLR